MDRLNISNLVKLAIFLALLLAGCRTTAAAPTIVPPIDTLAQTSDPLAIIRGELIEITYDGTDCIYSGPNELLIGSHTFVLKDLSDQSTGLWVGRILDGHTYQDLLDLQSEPGEYIPAPSWIRHPTVLKREWNENLDGEIQIFDFITEGEYYSTAGSYQPPIVWFCAPFRVIEAPSN